MEKFFWRTLMGRVAVELDVQELNHFLQQIMQKPARVVPPSHLLARLNCMFLYKRIASQIMFSQGKKKIKLNYAEAVALALMLDFTGAYGRSVAHKIRHELAEKDICF